MKFLESLNWRNPCVLDVSDCSSPSCPHFPYTLLQWKNPLILAGTEAGWVAEGCLINSCCWLMFPLAFSSSIWYFIFIIIEWTYFFIVYFSQSLVSILIFLVSTFEYIKLEGNTSDELVIYMEYLFSIYINWMILNILNI